MLRAGHGPTSDTPLVLESTPVERQPRVRRRQGRKAANSGRQLRLTTVTGLNSADPEYQTLVRAAREYRHASIRDRIAIFGSIGPVPMAFHARAAVAIAAFHYWSEQAARSNPIDDALLRRAMWYGDKATRYELAAWELGAREADKRDDDATAPPPMLPAFIESSATVDNAREEASGDDSTSCNRPSDPPSTPDVGGLADEPEWLRPDDSESGAAGDLPARGRTKPRKPRKRS